MGFCDFCFRFFLGGFDACFGALCFWEPSKTSIPIQEFTVASNLFFEHDIY